MKYTRYCRSILFTPALAVERFTRGQQAGADIYLVDLEDSVAPHHKEAARRGAEAFFAAPRTAPGLRAVRVNALSCPDGLKDLLALRACPAKPDILMLPKVESPRDLELVEQVLGEPCRQVELMAVVETARGLEHVHAIASATPRLKALVFGSADFSFSIGAALSWETLSYARARLVAAAHAAHRYVIDSATFNLSDPEVLEREARLAQQLGFSGKAAIHPRQVAPINQAFSPDERLLQRARRVLAESQAHDFNACVVDGMMVGLPFIDAARRLVEEFDTPAAAPQSHPPHEE